MRTNSGSERGPLVQTACLAPGRHNRSIEIKKNNVFSDIVMNLFKILESHEWNKTLKLLFIKSIFMTKCCLNVSILLMNFSSHHQNQAVVDFCQYLIFNQENQKREVLLWNLETQKKLENKSSTFDSVNY